MSFFFFFKQKTAYEMEMTDWSSDVCSSDLARNQAFSQFYTVILVNLQGELTLLLLFALTYFTKFASKNGLIIFIE